MAKISNKDTLSAYNRIMGDLQAGTYKPCYLLMGEEPFYVNRVASYIMDHALTEDEKAFNQMVFYGQEVLVSQVIDNARRYPVMASRQVIVGFVGTCLQVTHNPIVSRKGIFVSWERQ
jgi:hypothetical protein